LGIGENLLSQAILQCFAPFNFNPYESMIYPLDFPHIDEYPSAY
jgi:hypothetical protein